MILAHARRPPDGHRHVPLHRRRGLDEAPARPRRRGYAEALAEHRRVDPGRLRRGGRGRGGHPGRCLLLRLSDGARSARAAARRSTRRWRPARSTCASVCTPGRRSSPTRATSVTTFTAPPASRPPATAGRCSSPPPTAQLVELELSDLGEHRLKDLVRARAHLPARGRRASRPLKSPLPHEPARASDAVPRTRAGARRGRRAPLARPTRASSP